MSSERKLQKLEDSLDPKQRVLLHMEQVDKAGGFLQYGLNLVAEPFSFLPWLANFDAHFLYVLVNEVNVYVLAQRRRWDDTILFAACASRHGLAILKYDVNNTTSFDLWHRRFAELLQELSTIEQAVTSLSSTYLNGRSILFSDAAAVLKGFSEKAHVIVEVYNNVARHTSLQSFMPEQLTGNPLGVEKTVASFCGWARAHTLDERGLKTQAKDVNLQNVLEVVRHSLAGGSV